MGLGIPPLKIKIVLESNPRKPTMLVGGLGVFTGPYKDSNGGTNTKAASANVYVYIYIYIYI